MYNVIFFANLIAYVGVEIALALLHHTHIDAHQHINLSTL